MPSLLAKKNNLAIVLILLLAIFLRFYNLPDVFVFGGDEEHHVLLANTIVENFHIIWVGVNVAHLGFYHGPFFTYFTALWMYLTQDPIILGFVAATLGVITTTAVIFVGYKLFGIKVALIAGLLYATLPLMVFYDQRYWNPSITPLLMLGMVYSIYQSKLNSIWLILFAVCYGLVFHTHFSLIPMPLIAAYFIFKEKIKISRRALIFSIVIFLLTISPLIAFDYFQKGRLITAPFRLNQISKDSTNKINPTHHTASLIETLGRIWYLEPNRTSSDETLASCTSTSLLGTPVTVDEQSTRTKVPLLSILSAILIGYFLIRKTTWKTFNTSLIALSIILIISTFLIFPGGAYEYYIRGIFPLILFIPGIFLIYFKKEAILFFIIILSGLGIYTVLTASGEYGLNTKKQLISQVTKVTKNGSFEIKQDSSICHQYEGWRQLFIAYANEQVLKSVNEQVLGYANRKPARSFSDGSLGWYYPNEISDKPVDFTIILGDRRVPPNFDTTKSQIITSGGFNAYIFNNH